MARRASRRIQLRMQRASPLEVALRQELAEQLQQNPIVFGAAQPAEGAPQPQQQAVQAEQQPVPEAVREEVVDAQGEQPEADQAGVEGQQVVGEGAEGGEVAEMPAGGEEQQPAAQGPFPLTRSLLEGRQQADYIDYLQRRVEAHDRERRAEAYQRRYLAALEEWRNQQLSPLERLAKQREDWLGKYEQAREHLVVLLPRKRHILQIQERECMREKPLALRELRHKELSELDEIGMTADERESFEKHCREAGVDVEERREIVREEMNQCEVGFLCSLPHGPALTEFAEWHEVSHPWRLEEACINCGEAYPSFGGPCGCVTLCRSCSRDWCWNGLQERHKHARCGKCMHPTPFFSCLI